MMANALFLGLGLFTVCWLLHVIIWRIHRPEAYPLWLPVIFFAVPLLVALVVFMLHIPRPWRCADTWSCGVAALLHASIAACYMGGYAGVIEYSPSAEILRVVRAGMPDGVPVDSVIPQTAFSEDALTGKRIKHLLDSRMVVLDGGTLRLTPAGERVVSLCLAYRAVFGLKEEARG